MLKHYRFEPGSAGECGQYAGIIHLTVALYDFRVYRDDVDANAI
jgi:hypothetical protein